MKLEEISYRYSESAEGLEKCSICKNILYKDDMQKVYNGNKEWVWICERCSENDYDQRKGEE